MYFNRFFTGRHSEYSKKSGDFLYLTGMSVFSDLFFLSLLSFGLFLLPAKSLWAHPVVFAGGTALTYTSDGHSRDFTAGYSLTHRLSLNFRYLDLVNTSEVDASESASKSKSTRGDVIHFAQVNVLAKRFNMPASQGNIYLGAGVGDKDHSLFRIDADWEDRKYYIASAYEKVFERSNRKAEVSKVRLGFAPYVADSGMIHSWLIMQYSRNSIAEPRDSVTPILRLFHRNVLFEIGSSFRGDAFLTLMTHI